MEGRFSNSWNTLQDTFGLLRIIKKFSAININFFEQQLSELEKTYPYIVFFSPGWIVEYFECSICGENIDSLACSHRRGELYSGKLAVGIARNILEAIEISIVSVPRDKRCVVKYGDLGDVQ